MNNLFDRMRSGAEKAAFEADKLRRLSAAQSDLRGLRDEMNKAVNQIGRIAFDLHQRGQGGPPELSAACEAATAVLAQISTQEAEIERIRNEQFLEHGADAKDPSPLVCPVGHGPLAAGARYCQQCGQPGVPVAPVALIPCPTCGAALQPDARFYYNCGQPMPAADAAPQPPAAPARSETVRLDSTKPVAACPSCGTPVLDASESFCSTCGYPFKRAT